LIRYPIKFPLKLSLCKFLFSEWCLILGRALLDLVDFFDE
jgi:hypothetical protein